MKMKRSSQRSSRARKRTSAVRDIARLEDIPNVGPSVAGDLRRLGITSPGDLAGRDPYALYDELCRITSWPPHGSCNRASLGTVACKTGLYLPTKTAERSRGTGCPGPADSHRSAASGASSADVATSGRSARG